MKQSFAGFGSFGRKRLRLPNRRTVLALIFALIAPCGSELRGAAPTVKYLFPLGAQRGATTEVSAAGDFSNWPAKVWTSDSGLQVACGEAKGKLSVAVDPNTKTGVHFIRLYDDEGASKPIPFVVGNLPEVVEQASNDSPDKAESLPSSVVTVNGRLEKRDDVDVYAVELSKGQTTVASVVANEKLASPMDGVLQIVTATGSVLAQNDDWHGLDPQIVFTAPSDGKYLVRIFAFPAQPDSRIGLSGGEDFVYRLTVTCGPFVDYAWPLAVRQEESREIELVGWNLAEPINRQTVTASKSLFTISGDRLAGQLALAIEPQLCLIEVEPNESGEPQAIELPVTISGRLQQAEDRDAFCFQAKRGEMIRFQLDGRELGSPLDAVVELTDVSGKSLLRTDDSDRRRDPELSWKAPADGEFRVVVSDLHGRGGERFFYRLRAMRADGDFRITAAEHSFAGTTGKPLEISLEIDRQFGFDQEIIIKPEGLPDSIVVEPVISANDGDTAKKVKLRLTASTAFSGPLRIRGIAKGPTERAREAVFKLPDETEMAGLWLTFKADKQE